MEQKIFEIENLKELEEFLQSQSDVEQMRIIKMPENGIKPFAFARVWLLSAGEITNPSKH